MLLDGVNAPYNRPQKPLASASNVVNWHEVINTGTHEQHSWLLAGAQVGGRAWIEPGHDGDIATMNDRAFVFSSQCAMGLEPVGMTNVDQCMKTLPTPCARPTINAGVPRNHTESGIMHAAGHFELLNKYIHKPTVVELFKIMFLAAWIQCCVRGPGAWILQRQRTRAFSRHICRGRCHNTFTLTLHTPPSGVWIN